MTPMRSEREIDDAIDRAVREMMMRDPRPGLRGRVLAGLRRQPAAATTWLAGFRLAVAAALIVALASAGWRILRPPIDNPAPQTAAVPARPSTTPAPPPSAPSTDAAPSVTATRPRTAAPSSVAAPRVPRRAPPSFPARGAVAAASVVADPDPVPLPARPADPIDPGSAALPGGEIGIRMITIAPLWIEPLTVAPIRPPR